ncbi:MAG: glycosyltransferase family 9 protein [Chitinophagaceae bacterium]|jgi:ADP-heptose:LPS heptosyltransferase|nr:glycosyltransferase family 9 protein [Chitinophagaceae bacterium]MBP6047521.1 glycosyltransferase family 9 protein [Ferruginibacter sp.]NMD28555.1 glycosyltransferase family 9 protein [Bacteroidota bacterium]MBK7087415.1 glycosyltransferase family 9 protein [Chitinophagaceae bacterium]MBK7346199.1 glycosyltransferase family 9 protein [Chitinophagaceae bacterium]
MTKILVIRFSSIGDIVLASPAFRCIKKQMGDTALHFITKYSFKKVTEYNPYIDKFFYYQNNLKELVKQLKAENYDYVIDLHNNFRSAKIKFALRKPSFTIQKLSLQKFLLTEFSLNLMPKKHITQRSLETVAPLGVQDDGLGLDFFIPENEMVTEDHLPTSHQAGFICLVIGASYATKKLPVHKLKELCSKINHPIILIGGKEDRSNGKKIAAADPVKVYNSCGKYNLLESADLIRKSKLVISHDTGMQYIACAFQKQVLAIWGATTPQLDVAPYYGTAYRHSGPYPIYENISLNLCCQPCSKYGEDKCPLEHFNCMEKLDMGSIAANVHRRLSEK